MLTVRNYIEAAKRRKKEETGEEGFSLIELIIVVVILGILVAIAIPVFLNISQQAKDNSVKTATANAATQAAAAIAQGSPASDFSNLTKPFGTTTPVTLTLAGTTVDTVCVSGYGGGSTYTSGAPYKSGPGC